MKGTYSQLGETVKPPITLNELKRHSYQEALEAGNDHMYSELILQDTQSWLVDLDEIFTKNTVQ